MLIYSNSLCARENWSTDIWSVNFFLDLQISDAASFASLLISHINGFAFRVVQISLNVSHIKV